MRGLSSLLGMTLALSLVVAAPAGADTQEPTEASLAMPASATDRTTVTITASWRRSSDEVGVTGRLDIEFRRTGTTTWARYSGVDVVDGEGTVTIRPRDDGMFRAVSAGSDELAPVTSAPVAFDNRPTAGVRMRVAQFNLPGPDKLKRASARATRAARLVRRADPDVVVLNELVGPGRDALVNRPSRFARAVLARLGSRWRLITPTTTYNENYIAYRYDRVRVIAQYPDRVIPGTGTGLRKALTSRHLTPVLFKDLGSNQPVFVGGTHLVHNNRKAARRQAYSVARHARSLAHGYPLVIAGDMNTSDRLTGLTRIGLKDARRYASTHVKRTYATYTKYSKRKPAKSARWIIDQIYVPRSWTVRRWVTVLDTKDGRFIRPRPSDHALVWVSLAGPRPR